MSFGNRTDANHAKIRARFRELCPVVIDCSQIGMGFADLLVVTQDNELTLVEVKDGSKKLSARRLTKMQKKVAAQLCGHFVVVTSVPDVEYVSLGYRSGCTGVDYIRETESK